MAHLGLLPTRDTSRHCCHASSARFSRSRRSFSAIKVDGARAYDLARGGEEFVLEPREVLIEDLTLVDMPDAATAVLEVALRQGHLRAGVGARPGQALGTVAHVEAFGARGSAALARIKQFRWPSWSSWDIVPPAATRF